jgi:hypothetical protein
VIRNIATDNSFYLMGQTREALMFIQNQTANHQLCWNGPISIRLPHSAMTEVTNPLIALDILKHHWEGQPKDDNYDMAVEACLRAARGQGDLSGARSAFLNATQHLMVHISDQDPAQQATDASSHQ